MEGFGRPGVTPTRDNNPGDLRHSPHSSHTGEGPNDIGEINTVADGWADLERQLKLYADRGMTIQQAVYEFAPPNENNTANYLEFVCKGLGMQQDEPISAALEVPAA